MKELTARELLSTFQEICGNMDNCSGCILANENNDCYLPKEINLEKTLKIVAQYKWSWLDKLLNEFPQTKLNDEGFPNFCPQTIGKSGHCPESKSCLECWSERVK